MSQQEHTESMHSIKGNRSSPSAEVMPCRVPCQGTVPGPGGPGGAGGGDGGMGGGLRRYTALRHGCHSDICQSTMHLHAPMQAACSLLRIPQVVAASCYRGHLQCMH